MNDKSYDWRILTVIHGKKNSEITGLPTDEDVTAFLLTRIKNQFNVEISFHTPSTIRMSMNIAINSGKIAVKQFDDLVPLLKKVNAFGPIHYDIDTNDSTKLYDYFEQVMISAVFSLQAIDLLCNHIIATNLKNNSIYLKINKKGKNYRLKDLESLNLSTGFKINIIIPKLLKKPSLEQEKEELWGNYIKIKKIRDKIVHMIPSDENNIENIKFDTVFFNLFFHSPIIYPLLALSIMDYYKGGLSEMDWVELKMRELEPLQRIITVD